MTLCRAMPLLAVAVAHYPWLRFVRVFAVSYDINTRFVAGPGLLASLHTHTHTQKETRTHRASFVLCLKLAPAFGLIRASGEAEPNPRYVRSRFVAALNAVVVVVFCGFVLVCVCVCALRLSSADFCRASSHTHTHTQSCVCICFFFSLCDRALS